MYFWQEVEPGSSWLVWDQVVPGVFAEGFSSEHNTDRHTHRMTTVTLAAHAHRGLIKQSTKVCT